ncbi:MAG: acyltransferase [Bacteroidales bacterium]|nr:acyltransferase [Bacteroidales bacterium]MDD4216379.1 acyltransferase [Bacteroidales bacterium]MDY0140942.1 acyltransferase [Bacteroidales bacterium]
MKNFDIKNYTDRIFKIRNEEEFYEMSVEAFKYQYQNNKTYREFCDLLNINTSNIDHPTKIPFIPIDFFKTHKLISGLDNAEMILKSSGTSGSEISKHFVTDIKLYEQSFINNFDFFYGNPNKYAILGLLPSYLERTGSSLIYMVSKLCELSKNSMSGFYLNNYDDLNTHIIQLEKSHSKYILIGVSYALLDLAEKYSPKIQNGIVMETGGMKGRRQELTKEELHKILAQSFSTQNIHSEYGMTELLSQAYSKNKGLFRSPPQMRTYIREHNDPLSVKKIGTGAINIIDLANINSCCFIATSDLGIVYKDNKFSISGRLDNADIRGCNLMVY